MCPTNKNSGSGDGLVPSRRTNDDNALWHNMVSPGCNEIKIISILCKLCQTPGVISEQMKLLFLAISVYVGWPGQVTICRNINGNFVLTIVNRALVNCIVFCPAGILHKAILAYCYCSNNTLRWYLWTLTRIFRGCMRSISQHCIHKHINNNRRMRSIVGGPDLYDMCHIILGMANSAIGI